MLKQLKVFLKAKEKINQVILMILNLVAERGQVVEGIRSQLLQENPHVVGEVVHVGLQLGLLKKQKKFQTTYFILCPCVFLLELVSNNCRSVKRKKMYPRLLSKFVFSSAASGLCEFASVVVNIPRAAERVRRSLRRWVVALTGAGLGGVQLTLALKERNKKYKA